MKRLNTHLSYTNSVDPNQTPPAAASELGLHCLPVPFYGKRGKNGLIRSDFDKGSDKFNHPLLHKKQSRTLLTAVY